MKKIVYLFLLVSSIVFGQSKPFSFIAFGDAPYKLPEDYARFELLIKKVNKEHPAFSVHVGDFKSGSTPCTEEYFEKVKKYFNDFEQPLIYTPGDNEWTDCDRPACGSYSPEERLAVLRKYFFATNNSFGKHAIALSPQSLDANYSKFVENRFWTKNQLLFATIHLVGTNNNLRSQGENLEFYEREKANLNWLEKVFKEADNKLGLVIFTQADMFFDKKPGTGFVSVLKKLKELTVNYGKPVLLINGDSHKLIIDKPLIDNDKKVIMNFTRIQVFGESEIAGVKIHVIPKSYSLFQFEELQIEK